jgi:hypothetical protein
VTSRIDRNSRSLCYLIFSTRHLNATPEKRKNGEKFNTRVRFFAASDYPGLFHDRVCRIEEFLVGPTPTHRYAIAGKSSRILPSLPMLNESNQENR